MAKSNKSEEKVTRVKAKDSSAPKTEAKKPKVSKYAAKVSGKKVKKTREPAPKFVRIIFAPFFAIGRYLRDSWRELRKVRWPNRRETWKMTGAVIAFTVAFATLIISLDAFFEWTFKVILG